MGNIGADPWELLIFGMLFLLWWEIKGGGQDD